MVQDEVLWVCVAKAEPTICEACISVCAEASAREDEVALSLHEGTGESMSMSWWECEGTCMSIVNAITD